MSKEKVHILIVGDELGLGEPMQQAFEREGHDVEHVQLADQAFTYLTQKKVDYVFVDCMLQGGMNGVDFVLHVRDNFKNVTAKYVMMSGIFIDRGFQKEALEKTGAIAFIEKKPGFDFKNALKYIKQDEVKSVLPPARKLLYQMFAKEKVSTREKRKVIESLEEVSGFDLPFVFSLLVETGSSGYLNVYEKNGSVSGISFSQGNIVAVDAEDGTTFLGEMLIQSGFVLPEDLRDALAEKSNRRLGVRLVKSSRLSPHALDLIVTQQMNVRLSRMITDRTIRINFAATEVELAYPHISSDELQYFLHDWIASKISATWLKSLYMVLASNPLNLSPAYKADHPALNMGLVKALPRLFEHLKNGATLNKLLEQEGYNEAAVYKGIHFLLTKGLVVFGTKAVFASEADQVQALRKIATDIQGRTPVEIVEIFGLEHLQGEGLDTLMGPCPKDPSGATFWKGVRQKLEEASRVSMTQVSRDKSRQEAVEREAESKMKAGQQIEEARKALGFNQYAKALTMLQETQKTHPQIEQIHILIAWAKLGQVDPSRRAAALKEIEFELMQVPPEERYDAHYSFVLGLFNRTRGDLAGAKKHFERAISLNSSLMVARREIASLETQMKKEKDIFGGFMDGLFKRSK